MALPLAPGAQVGETRGCHLRNAADTSGNLSWVEFLVQKMCCLQAAGSGDEGGQPVPGWWHSLAGSVCLPDPCLGSPLCVVEVGAAAGGAAGCCWLCIRAVQGHGAGVRETFFFCSKRQPLEV